MNSASKITKLGNYLFLAYLINSTTAPLPNHHIYSNSKSRRLKPQQANCPENILKESNKNHKSNQTNSKPYEQAKATSDFYATNKIQSIQPEPLHQQNHPQRNFNLFLIENSKEAVLIVCLALSTKLTKTDTRIQAKIHKYLNKHKHFSKTRKTKLVDRYIINSLSNCSKKLENQDQASLNKILNDIYNDSNYDLYIDYLEYDNSILKNFDYKMTDQEFELKIILKEIQGKISSNYRGSRRNYRNKEFGLEARRVDSIEELDLKASFWRAVLVVIGIGVLFQIFWNGYETVKNMDVSERKIDAMIREVELETGMRGVFGDTKYKASGSFCSDN